MNVTDDDDVASVADDVAVGRRPSVVLARATDYLERHGVEPARPAAEALLAKALGIDRASLFTRSEPLDPEQSVVFGRMLCQRCSGTPVQHLTGEQGFRHLLLDVVPGVLIPRPETEVVVDVALGVIDSIEHPVVVDIGTGSGAIAIAIATEHPGAQVFATDISEEAVALAAQNAAKHTADVTLVLGDLFASLDADLRGTVDLVVSNPPYLTEEEYLAVEPEVAADPRGALVGGTDVHERIAEASGRWLRPGGALVLEIGMTQGSAVRDILDAHGFERVEIREDLAARDRIVVGIRRA